MNLNKVVPTTANGLTLYRFHDVIVYTTQTKKTFVDKQFTSTAKRHQVPNLEQQSHPLHNLSLTRFLSPSFPVATGNSNNFSQENSANESVAAHQQVPKFRV